MTNGEKIQQMFPRKCPHIGFNENFGRIWLMQDGEDFANFTLKWWNAEYKEPTTENTLAVNCIDRAELLKAMDTWDKFGCDADTKLVPYQDHYIPYIHYDDVIKCIKVCPHWIENAPEYQNIDPPYICSECGNMHLRKLIIVTNVEQI